MNIIKIRVGFDASTIEIIPAVTYFRMGCCVTVSWAGLFIEFSR